MKDNEKQNDPSVDQSKALTDWFERRHLGLLSESQSCSFCDTKDSQQVQIIAGPDVYICSDCVAICSEIVAEKLGPHCSFCNKVAGDVEVLVKRRPGVAICSSCVDTCQKEITRYHIGSDDEA